MVQRLAPFIRYLGITAATFAVAQSILWIFFSIMAIICTYGTCGHGSFALEMRVAYLDLNYVRGIDCESCLVPPIAIHIIAWIYLILSILWLILSLKLICVYRAWVCKDRIKYTTKIWALLTIAICVIDFTLFLAFIMELGMKAKFVNLRKHAEETRRKSAGTMSRRWQMQPPVPETTHLIMESHEPMNETTDDLIDDHENPFVEGQEFNKFPFAMELADHVSHYRKPRQTDVTEGDIMSPTPSAILMTIAIRGFLPWFINLIHAILLLLLMNNLACLRKKKDTNIMLVTGDEPRCITCPCHDVALLRDRMPKWDKLKKKKKKKKKKCVRTRRCR